MQPGDVEKTFSDTSKLKKWINYKPQTELKEGVQNFIAWYKRFYKIS